MEGKEGKSEHVETRVTRISGPGVKGWLMDASAVAAGSAVGAAVTSLVSYAVDRSVDTAAAAAGGGIGAGGAFGF